MQLTNDFHLTEFQSKDGAEMPQWVFDNIMFLADNLQIIRDEIGKPIMINSAYRSPQHNAKIGGVKNSQHTLGNAADLSVRDMTPNKLSKVILRLIKQGRISEGGVGLYNGFVHYDIRGYKARWDKSSWYNFF